MGLARILLCGLLTAFIGCSTEEGGGGDAAPRLGSRPNLLLLVSDDQGTVLGCYGTAGVETPRLDALAAQGVKFTRAYAPTAVCTPSRTSIYTGLMPAKHGAKGFEPVGDDVRLWSSYFADAGYRTGLIGKLGAKPIKRFDFDFLARSSKDADDARAVEWHVEQLDAFLDAGDERPWVLVVNFRDSHWPFPRDGAPIGPDAITPHSPDAVTVPPALADTLVTRTEIARYYDGLRRMDATVGAMVDRLAERGDDGNTLGLFTSDNGPPFPCAKTMLYEAGIHMPMIAWNAGEPREVASFVSLVDILPTFLDFAGVETVAGLDGRSFRPLLERGDAAASEIGWRDAIFATHDSHRIDPPVPARSVRFGDWKYIRTWGDGKEFRNGVMETSDAWGEMVRVANEGDAAMRETVARVVRRPKEELFDLASDPNEQRDLSGNEDAAAVLEEARRRLRESTDVVLPGAL